MATNKTGRRLQSFQTGLHSLNILPQIVHVDGNLEEAMFLTLLNQIGMAPTFNKKFSFYEDDWLPATDTVDGAVSGTTATTIKVDTIGAFVPNQLWQNKRTGEIYFVESVNTASNTIEVTRQVGRDSTNSTGTEAAAINDADTLIRIGSSMGEVSQRQTTHTTTPAEVFNYTEKKRYEIQMSDVQRKTKHETGNDWPYQIDKTFKQARKDLNGALYISERNKVTLNGQQHWTMGGVDFFISTNSLSSSGTLYEYAFDEWLADKAMFYGPAEKTLFASMNLIKALNQIAKDALERSFANFPMGDANPSVRVLTYDAPSGGRLNVVHDKFLTTALNGTGYVVDMGVVRMRHFDGDGLSGLPHVMENTQEVDSDDSAQAMIWDMGPEWGPEKHHGKLSGVTQGAGGRAIT